VRGRIDSGDVSGPKPIELVARKEEQQNPGYDAAHKGISRSRKEQDARDKHHQSRDKILERIRFIRWHPEPTHEHGVHEQERESRHDRGGS